MYDCMSRQAVQECRFCKNNGERESYYRGHRLRDARGAVRVCMIVCRGRRCRSVGSARTTASASRTTAGTGCATRAARCESMYDCMSRQAVQECRFCKNNGERESYYRGHRLRDARGAVCCPVLRAFRCPRCGAAGDRAHTSKYCPLATADERMKSTAMMRSVRMASGRRRNNTVAPSVADTDNYMVFGEATPSVISDTDTYKSFAQSSPLDPLWAALEKKLML
ncbi:hypothetical protein HF086_014464 [Spodoptera exigua]|uniref:Nanos-type domain-containing protein n=1 Tax=Spodoptera exigua TaxID=7107 RepID=A0A922SEZ7_SPOEX|nr:hypothetical protein HF086_014464 [Spodoptera exigua]